MCSRNGYRRASPFRNKIACTMLSVDDLFRRNFQYARSINYDLSKVHSADVRDMIRTSADSLLLDEQMLSLTLRAAAAFHLDTAKIRIDNDEHREKHVVDYTLIITTIGSGKSTIFNKLSQATTKREGFEKQRKVLKSSNDPLRDIEADENKPKKKALEARKDDSSRYAVTNDFTGAGIFKSLNDTGNVLILIDEFDGEHQKSNIFTTDGKTSSNGLTSANSILKTMHTGVDSYRKTRADGLVTLSKPHITFIAASNGSVVVEILRKKLKAPTIPDAMVERFLWEALMTSTKLNSTRLVQIPPKSIGLELFFLASSLLSNHTFVFQPDANVKMCDWMDELALARARWDEVDAWFSGRLAKSIDQTARIAVQLNHIELTMQLLKQFIMTCDFNTFGSISSEIYFELADFIEAMYPPVSNTTIDIAAATVDSAIYSIRVSMVKYLNLFNTDLINTSAILDLPMHPPEKVIKDANPWVANVSTTQQLATSVVSEHKNSEFQNLQKLVMLFPSITFTRTMLYIVSKLKAKQNLLNHLLESLVEVGLLKRFDKGVVTGTRRTTLFIKSLPVIETLNTTNQFTLDLLDKINLPWLLYRPTCTTLLLPNNESVLSDEPTEYLESGIYKNVITHKGVAKKNLNPSTASSQPSNINALSPVIRSTDSNTITFSSASPSVDLSPTKSVNANMPRPPPSTSGALTPLSAPSQTNERVDPAKSEDGRNKSQQQAQSKIVTIVEENKRCNKKDRPANMLRSIRRSSRIQGSKRLYRGSSINSSAKKKKNK